MTTNFTHFCGIRKLLLSCLIIWCDIAAHATIHTVQVANFSFTPSATNAVVGDTMMWQWVSGTHTTTSTSVPTGAATWDSPMSSSSQTFQYVLTVAGTYNYHCSIHPTLMMGTITVTAPQAAVTFQTLYGVANDTSDSWAANILQTADGGYITAGYVSNFGAGGDEVSFIKLTATGDTAWVKIYGVAQNLSDDDVTQFIQTNDGGYALAGLTQNFNGQDAFLIKTDADGNLSWTKIYGSGGVSSNAEVNSLVQTADSGFVMTGYINNYGAGNGDVYLLKTDASGNVIWTKTYGGGNADFGSSVAATRDGGYIISGTTSSFADTLGDVYLIKTDANGDTLWTWTYGSNLTDAMDMGNAVQQTADNGYIITGATMSTSQGSFALLLKTDSNGVMQWSKLYGANTSASNAYAAALVQTTDGGYAIAGYISNFGAGGQDYYLVKTDANGDTIFTRTFGGPNADYASGLTQTADNGFMIAGWTAGFQYNAGLNGDGFAYYVKTDANGHTGGCNEYNTGTTINSSITFYALRTATQVSSGGVDSSVTFITLDGGTMLGLCDTATGINDVNASNMDVNVYPNPSSGQFEITSSQLIQNIAVYDVTGRIIYSREINSDNVSLDLGKEAKGIYLIRMFSGNESIIRKIVISN